MSTTIPQLPYVEGHVVLLVPTHEVPQDVVVKRKRGRPKKIDPRPIWDEHVHHSVAAQVALQAIEQDEVYRCSMDYPCTDMTVRSVIKAAAIEAAHLRVLREDSTAIGKDVGQVCSRRVEALSRLAGLVVQHARSGQASQQVTTARIKQIKKLWIDKVKAVALDVLPAEVAQKLIEQYATALEHVDLTR